MVNIMSYIFRFGSSFVCSVIYKYSSYSVRDLDDLRMDINKILTSASGPEKFIESRRMYFSFTILRFSTEDLKSDHSIQRSFIKVFVKKSTNSSQTYFLYFRLSNLTDLLKINLLVIFSFI